MPNNRQNIAVKKWFPVAHGPDSKLKLIVKSKNYIF